MSLARWGKGLTVLLEKILGNVFVHKLCAICLLEADFNWWNKLIFAKKDDATSGEGRQHSAGMFCKETQPL
jgi:hypothetical protein